MVKKHDLYKINANSSRVDSEAKNVEEAMVSQVYLIMWLVSVYMRVINSSAINYEYLSATKIHIIQPFYVRRELGIHIGKVTGAV